MEVLTSAEVRNFRVRANYFNQRSLLWRTILHSQQAKLIPKSLGYSAPVVKYETEEGMSASTAVSENDLPFL